MNKTILGYSIGCTVVSLAVGSGVGYLVAKKRFEVDFNEAIAKEIEATKKHYDALLEKAKKEQSDDSVDIEEEDAPESADEDLDDEEIEEESSAKHRKTAEDAEKALTDYQGISTRIVVESGQEKPPLETLVENNIFRPKKAIPPRGPGGKFRKQTAREAEYDPPQIIDAETFLLNDPDYNQESLLYFVNDKTLVLEADATESVDIDKVGEVNLTLFPDTEPSIIYVRNDGLSIDYEIKKTEESLTEFIGLGENEGEDEQYDDAAYL